MAKKKKFWRRIELICLALVLIMVLALKFIPDFLAQAVLQDGNSVNEFAFQMYVCILIAFGCVTIASIISVLYFVRERAHIYTECVKSQDRIYTRYEKLLDLQGNTQSLLDETENSLLFYRRWKKMAEKQYPEIMRKVRGYTEEEVAQEFMTRYKDVIFLEATKKTFLRLYAFMYEYEKLDRGVKEQVTFNMEALNEKYRVARAKYTAFAKGYITEVLESEMEKTPEYECMMAEALNFSEGLPTVIRMNIPEEDLLELKVRCFKIYLDHQPKIAFN